MPGGPTQTCKRGGNAGLDTLGTARIDQIRNACIGFKMLRHWEYVFSSHFSKIINLLFTITG